MIGNPEFAGQPIGNDVQQTLADDRAGDHDPASHTVMLHCVECESAVGGLDVVRLERALRAIHGDVIPLPNQPQAAEWAAIIADWYERDDPGHPGRHLRHFRDSQMVESEHETAPRGG